MLKIKEHKQYHDFFNLIHSSKLCINLCIPTQIEQEIAKYSTGDVKYCSNKECGEPICIFTEKKIKFDNDDKQTEYTYCSNSDNYWCSNCIYQDMYASLLLSLQKV